MKKDMIWLADLTYTQQTIAADTIPAAIGGIAAYTEKELGLSGAIRLYKYPEKLSESLNHHIPRIIGFSNYIWNLNLSLAFARVIKKKYPETVVIFGGPNFPYELKAQEDFLRQNRQIDFYIVKEGEKPFHELVKRLIEKDYHPEQVHGKVASVYSIDKDGNFYVPDNIDRIQDLSLIPSPYLTGKLDEFFDGKMLPVLQTNRGCPFGCTFCVEGVPHYNRIYRHPMEKLRDEVDYIGRKMAALREKGGRNDLFIADSNFGMYKPDLDFCRALAKAQETYQWPEYINVATGKNKKERVLQAAQLVNGAMRLSGSVQSLEKTVLENINRKNISADQLMQLAIEAGAVGANSYCEIILALPGDSRKAHFNTIRRVMEAGFTNIYLFQLMLLPGTKLSTSQTRSDYEMDIRYRVLPRCYGDYNVLGEQVISAEIEQICVSHHTLSFQDYLECRKLHLIITLFYNDGVFEALLKYLRLLDVSLFRWMEILSTMPINGGLGRLFEQFQKATENELWQYEHELQKFATNRENIKKYISGKLGNNLLFVHKTSAIVHHPEQLSQVAITSVVQLLEENGVATEKNIEFVHDAAHFQLCRMSNIFNGDEKVTKGRFTYDIVKFTDDPSAEAIAAYRYPNPVELKFEMADEQKAIVKRYLGIYGTDTVGIGRVLSKVYVKKIFRNPSMQGL